MLSLTANVKYFPPSKVEIFFNIIRNEWKSICAEILKRDKSGPRFTWDDMQVFESCQEPHKKMFEAWKTDNITFQDLIDVLEKAKQSRAVTFIKEKVLNLKVVKAKPDQIEVGPSFVENSMVVPYEQLCKWTDNFNGRKISQGGTFISCGGFADVYRGVKGNTYVAVKKFKSLSDGLKMQFDNEIAILSQCNHPNVLTLLHYCNDGVHSCLVYDYMDNGSLYDYLINDANLNRFQFKMRLRVFNQCTEGLDYLHKIHIIHRDIKSANILLDNEMNAKLGDFGTTKIFAPTNETHVQTVKLIGTAIYMAPEYMTYGEVSYRIDMFSMGVVLVELLTGLVALDLERETPSILEIISEEFKLDPHVKDCPKDVFEDLKKLSLKLMSEKKSNRPSANEVLDILKPYC